MKRAKQATPYVGVGKSYSPPKQGGFSDAVWNDPDLQEYLRCVGFPVFGWVGAHCRTDARDSLVEKVLRYHGHQTAGVAEWLMSHGARHFANGIEPKATQAFFVARLKRHLQQWPESKPKPESSVSKAALESALDLGAATIGSAEAALKRFAPKTRELQLYRRGLRDTAAALRKLAQKLNPPDIDEGETPQ